MRLQNFKLSVPPCDRIETQKYLKRIFTDKLSFIRHTVFRYMVNKIYPFGVAFKFCGQLGKNEEIVGWAGMGHCEEIYRGFYWHENLENAMHSPITKTSRGSY